MIESVAMGTMATLSASEEELSEVVAYLVSRLPANAVVFLRGDLAAGKTTLVKAIAAAKGIEGEVTSPTFSLQHKYGEDLYHYDLYRIDEDTLMQTGLIEAFEAPGWHMVEWGDERLKTFLESVGYNVVTIEIAPHGAGRIYRIGD